MRERNKILYAAIGINILNGMLYTWSTISKYIVMDWGWKSSMASLPYTLHSLFIVFGMIVFGNIQDEKGPRLIASIGSILLGLGLIVSGMTQNLIIMCIGIGIMVGTGIGMQTITTGPTAIKWFDNSSKGKINGLVSAGVGISGIIYSLLGNFLINRFNVNITLIIMGIISLVLSFPLALMLKNPDKEYMENLNIENQDNLYIENDYNSAYMLRDKKFYGIWFMKIISTAAGLLIIGHISMIAKIQADINNGVLLVTLTLVSNTLGRLLGGRISDYIGRTRLMRIVFIIQAINIFLFSKYNNIVLLILGILIAGFNYGTGVSVIPVMISDHYGLKHYGSNYGKLITAEAIGSILGPMLGGIIYDINGNYNMAYNIISILLIIGLFSSLVIKEDRIIKE